MQKTAVIKAISEERFHPYLKHAENNHDAALRLYQKNIEVSQSFYAPLSVLEITLRNKIDQQFQDYFNASDWLQSVTSNRVTETGLRNRNSIKT